MRIKSYVRERNRVNESECLAADEGQEDTKKKKEKREKRRTTGEECVGFRRAAARITEVIKTK